MSCPRPLLIITMIIAGGVTVYIIGFLLVNTVLPCDADTPCADGRVCPANWLCCPEGCCPSPTAPPRREVDEAPWTHKYPWPVWFLLGSLGGLLICCVWCLICKKSSQPRRSTLWGCSFTCCIPRPPADHDSAGSVYPPPRYSRCSSFYQAPPPYSEVTSKPNLYPLVITCGEGEGKGTGNYLLVHYFRNYYDLIRAPGSISAASTAESLNSSWTCNAANEANSIIPPPYSCASHYEDCHNRRGRTMLRSLSSLNMPHAQPPPRSRTAPNPQLRKNARATFRENLITSPVQPLNPSFDMELELIECDMYCDGGCKPRLGPSPPVHRSVSNVDDTIYEREVYGLRHQFACPTTDVAGACESPPQPTSPTQTSTESTLRRTSEERPRIIPRWTVRPKPRNSNLYIPLGLPHPSRKVPRVSSRSAPATPTGGFPGFRNMTLLVPPLNGSRSSQYNGENDPLLLDNEQLQLDHKF